MMNYELWVVNRTVNEVLVRIVILMGKSYSKIAVKIEVMNYEL